MSVAIIGGTGLEDLREFARAAREVVSTPFGDALVYRGTLAGREVFFLPRHGPGHALPPHRINYRANIAALCKLGVREVLATAAAGSLVAEVKPNTLLLPDQFLDFTRQRPQTFWDNRVVHIDLSEPYCPRLRGLLADAARRVALPCREGGTYVCVEGPRFESSAEVKMFARLGGHVVGMTGLPELVLAREANMCYAALCLVTNFAAGLGEGPVSHDEVLQAMAELREKAVCLLAEAIGNLKPAADCPCRRAAPQLEL